MLKQNSNIDFKAEIVENVKELLTLEEQRFFAWLCAVRSLPFLSTKRNFNCWKKSEIHTNLQSVLYAVDAVRAVRNTADVANSTLASNAALAADSAKTALDTCAENLTATLVTTAVTDAAFVAAALTSIEDSFALAVNAAALAANALAANAALCMYTKDSAQKFREVIINDVEMISAEKYHKFHNDTSIYGALWDNFQNDLVAIGCKYWADLYADLFTNHFQLKNKALEALERRIRVPAEVRLSGAAAVADYLVNGEKQGLVYSRRETRLIILGSAGAGKTTLAKRLNGELDYPAPKDSTHGVETSITLDFNGIRAHVWDFGGQVIYHSSHRCFLSENCVYILVVNAREDDSRDANRINYWLDTIRVYSDGKAKVFVIINESDNREQNPDDYNSFKDGEYGELIQEIYSFNIGEDMSSLNDFKTDLAAYVEAIGHQTFGKNDSRAIEKIKSLFDQKMQILKADEVNRILIENGIQAQKDQKRAQKLFNILGIAMSYDFMDSYVLDPYWISHGVYKVIDYLQKSKTNFINYNNLDAVFTDERKVYPESTYVYILKLIEHYRIGFRNKDGVRGLIIPCVASQFRPRKITISAEPDCIITQVEREDLQEFPADFFYKLICANEDDIKQVGETWEMWQTGMVLRLTHESDNDDLFQKNKHVEENDIMVMAKKQVNALVELKENRRIEITVWGRGKEEYSKKLESLIDNQLKEYHFTSFREERKRGGRLVNFITLVIESVSKGVTKAGIEAALGGVVKP